MPKVNLSIFLLLLFIGADALGFQLEVDFRNGKYGIIDTTETKAIILPFEFDEIGWDSSNVAYNGIIRAKQNERWALFTEKGKRLTQHEFVTLEPHSEGQFIASKRANNSILQHFGLINKTGRTLIPFELVRLESAQNNLISTKRSDSGFQQALFGSGGEVLIEGNFKRIIHLNAGFVKVLNTANDYALYNPSGEAITAFAYQEIEYLQNDLFIISKHNRLGVMSTSGEIMIPPTNRTIRIEGDRIDVESYPSWTLKTDEFQNTVYADKVDGLGDSLYVTQTNDHVGIINSNEDYKLYLKAHQIIQSNGSFAIVLNKKNGLYGLINQSGVQILPTNYDSLIIFEHFALAKILRASGENWFAHDQNGKNIHTKGYESVEQITAYDQVIATRNGKYGMISAYGKERIPFEFLQIEPVKENRFIVENERGIGLLQNHGRWLITPYKDSIAFNMDHYTFKQGSSNGISSLEGDQIARSTNEIYFLPEGYYEKTEDGHIPYDLNEKRIFEHLYDTIKAINDQLWYLQRGENRFFYRPEDSTSFELPSNVESMGQYKENHISFKKDGQWGFLNESGQLVVANRYDSVTTFSEGIASINLIGKWGAINRREEIVIQPKYEYISAFFNALAIVKRDGKYGLVDRLGKDVLDTKYGRIDRQKDYILLKIGQQEGISDIRGRLIKAPQYDQVRPLKHNYFLVTRGSKVGVINLKGTDVLPLIFDQIKETENGFLGMKKGEIKSHPLNTF